MSGNCCEMAEDSSGKLSAEADKLPSILGVESRGNAGNQARLLTMSGAAPAEPCRASSSAAQTHRASAPCARERGDNLLLPPITTPNDPINGHKDLVTAELHETLRTLCIGRTSPLRMRSVSPSPPNHFSLSPAVERRRANTYSAGQLTRPEVLSVKGCPGAGARWFSPPCSPARRRINTPRDAVQPSSGSFSDVSSDRHSSASGESGLPNPFSLETRIFFLRLFLRETAGTCVMYDSVINIQSSKQAVLSHILIHCSGIEP